MNGFNYKKRKQNKTWGRSDEAKNKQKDNKQAKAHTFPASESKIACDKYSINLHILRPDSWLHDWSFHNCF